MKKIEKQTSICSILCIILWQNSADTRFGHFLIENPDTGQKKVFLQLCLPPTPHVESLFWKPARQRVDDTIFEIKNLYISRDGISWNNLFWKNINTKWKYVFLYFKWKVPKKFPNVLDFISIWRETNRS